MTTLNETQLDALPKELRLRKIGAEEWVKEDPNNEMAILNLKQVDEIISRHPISRKELFASAPPPETMTKEEEDMVAGAVSRFGVITNPPPVLGVKGPPGIGDHAIAYGPGVPTGNS